MGATTFQTYGYGKDVREAFLQAKQDALYWSGHGGYTGTLAEKPGYHLFTLPPKVKPEKFLHWISEMAYEGEEDSYAKQALKQLESTRAPRGQGESYRKRKAELRKQIKEAERFRNSIPKEYLSTVIKAAAIYDDKWGNAIAFEVTGAAATKLKAADGHKGTHKKVFCFCGYASC